jgi:hypothetical protein
MDHSCCSPSEVSQQELRFFAPPQTFVTLARGPDLSLGFSFPLSQPKDVREQDTAAPDPQKSKSDQHDPDWPLLFEQETLSERITAHSAITLSSTAVITGNRWRTRRALLGEHAALSALVTLH